jgi:AmpE protein
MEFLVILTAWLLLQWLGPSSFLHRDRWLHLWYLRADGVLAPLPQPLRLLLIALLPPLLVAVLALLLAPLLGGVLLFALQLLVLSYSLGRGDFNVAIDAYLERWQRGDLEAAYQVALQQAAVPVEEGDAPVPVDDCAALHRQMRGHVVYGGLERWFAVVFWFFLLGPAAALFYRILQLLQRDAHSGAGERRWLAQWLLWLEWLPARLLGLAFAITGNFVDCFRVWRESFSGLPPTRELLLRYAEKALPGAVAQGSGCAEPAFLAAAATELDELRDMLRRSAICWLVVFALLQLL